MAWLGQILDKVNDYPNVVGSPIGGFVGSDRVSAELLTPSQPARIARVRRFNRFYTRQVGALDERHLHSPFSLAEARVLYEIANTESPSAAALGRELKIDPGYLSRLLKGLERRGLVERAPSADDRRRNLLRLTPQGRATFDDLDERARRQVATLLAPLSDGEQHRLLDAMRAIETLTGAPGQPVPYALRPPRPGDMGWVVHRQAVLYAREYGWNEEYEALISRIVAEFLERFDPERERCWIAERDGETVGSVFVVKHPERDGVAKLRLLYVEPAARGLGIGRDLVTRCTRFARKAGYHTLTLWTNNVLTSARRIYEAEGYRLVREEPHHSFGKDLIGQTWELTL
jgi:DNA-binding MarR family transcriptional regulator/GNAT superfamily N-acetyltransferase